MLKFNVLGFVLTASLLLLSTRVQAQWGYRGYGGGYGYGGGTVAGNYAMGMSDLVRSQGQANLLNSIAAGNLEDARSKDLDNRLKATNTYFELRKMNRSYREQEKSAPTSSEQIYRLAQQGAPRRTNALQLDPVSGAIAWPALFLDARYAAQREQLDKLFGARAAGNLSPAAFGLMKTATDAMLDILAKSVRDYSVADYSAARAFLRSLAYEANFPSA